MIDARRRGSDSRKFPCFQATVGTRYRNLEPTSRNDSLPPEAAKPSSPKHSEILWLARPISTRDSGTPPERNENALSGEVRIWHATRASLRCQYTPTSIELGRVLCLSEIEPLSPPRMHGSKHLRGGGNCSRNFLLADDSLPTCRGVLRVPHRFWLLTGPQNKLDRLIGRAIKVVPRRMPKHCAWVARAILAGRRLSALIPSVGTRGEFGDIA